MIESIGKTAMTAANVTAIQTEMMEQALRSCLVLVPVEEMVMESASGNSYRLIVRDLPMFETKCDMTALEIKVESWWINWPPPEKKLTKGKFSLID